MKQQIIRGLFALLALFFTAVSCRKDVQTTAAEPIIQAKSTIETVKGGFHVENGILHFDNSKAFRDVLEQLRKFDISVRRNFGVNQGFYSYLNGYGKVLDRSAAADKDDNGYDDFLRQNTDIIELRADGTFSMRLLNKSLAAVLNREGIVFIGKDAYRFTDWGEAIAHDGDVERLKTVNAKTPTSNNISIFAEKALPTRAPCGTWLMQNGVMSTAYVDKRGDFWCGIEKRREPAYDQNDLPLYDSNGKRLFDHITYSWSIGTPWKKNWRGRWVTYNSDNKLTINQSAVSNYNTVVNGLPSFDQCTFTDNISYTNCWSAIDYNSSGCVLFNAPEVNQNGGPLILAQYLNVNNEYKSLSDFFTINLSCQ